MESGIYSDWIKSQPTYYKYGITNILKAKMWTNTSLNSYMTMTATQKCTWKNKNENEQGRNAGLLLYDDKNITYTFYARSKRLVSFDILVNFHYDYMGKTMDTSNGIFWADAN